MSNSASRATEVPSAFVRLSARIVPVIRRFPAVTWAIVASCRVSVSVPEPANRLGTPVVTPSGRSSGTKLPWSHRISSRLPLK